MKYDNEIDEMIKTNDTIIDDLDEGEKDFKIVGSLIASGTNIAGSLLLVAGELAKLNETMKAMQEGRK